MIAVIPFFEVPEPDDAPRAQASHILGDLQRLVRVAVGLLLPGPFRIGHGALPPQDPEAGRP
jgi:hypothetical protein